jgi:ABC-type oligopeptide transport system ATPase subunit
LNLLNDLKAEYNLTFLFISHDLSVVNYMSDRVMVMREGEIVEYGTAEEIYTNPRHSYTQKLLDSVY